MQIIYAAPFIFLSILSFAVCLAIPRLRRVAMAALVVPVAFGICSITGWILFVLVCQFVLRIDLGAASGAKGIVEGSLFYLLPGIAGAWIATKIVRALERSILRTVPALHVAIACVVALVCAGIGGFIALGIATNYLPIGSTVSSLWIAFAASVLVGAAAFLITRIVQSRYRDPSVSAS